MYLHKIKQMLCRHRVTRGVTLLIDTQEKVVQCRSCNLRFVAKSVILSKGSK